MEFDTPVTAAMFVGVVILATAATMATPMAQRTVLMMVTPSLLVIGGVFLVLGVKHGEYRARQT